jgi:SAM-dependent methyltransferase
MSLNTKIAEQFRRPNGFWGRLAGRLMVRGNRAAYRQALPHLDLRPGNDVLEVGFGHGAGIAAVARVVVEGRIAGLDFSEEMCSQAAERLAPLVRSGRVTLHCGDLATYDLDGATFDRILAVNVIYFWPKPLPILRKLLALLRPDGILALTFTTPDALRRLAFTRTGVFHAYSGDEVAGLLRTAGFPAVDVVGHDVLLTVLGRARPR